MLARCPSCFHNFVNFWCQMTCSPDQATFTNAAKVTDDYVEELDYAVSMDYAQGMYDSCKDVSNPTTGLSLINFIKN